MVPFLLGKQGRAIKKLSHSMGGIPLRVKNGNVRGRATSLEAAREGTRKLQHRVSRVERGVANGTGGERRGKHPLISCCCTVLVDLQPKVAKLFCWCYSTEVV